MLLQLIEIDRLGDELESAEFSGAASPLVVAMPTACTPGTSWEKGQVENQVGLGGRSLRDSLLERTGFEPAVPEEARTIAERLSACRPTQVRT